MIAAVRKFGIEVRLERPGPAAHPPRTVVELRAEKKIDPAAVDRIGRLHARQAQSVEPVAQASQSIPGS